MAPCSALTQRLDVSLLSQQSCFKASHLARRSRLSFLGATANDVPHRRINAKALGVIQILITGEPAIHRLPEKCDHIVLHVGSGARVVKKPLGHRRQAERVVEFAVGKQSRVGGTFAP